MLCINSLAHTILTSLSVKIYVEDVHIYSVVNSPQKEFIMQQGSLGFYEWIERFNLKLFADLKHADKCRHGNAKRRPAEMAR